MIMNQKQERRGQNREESNNIEKYNRINNEKSQFLDIGNKSKNS